MVKSSRLKIGIDQMEFIGIDKMELTPGLSLPHKFVLATLLSPTLYFHPSIVSPVRSPPPLTLPYYDFQHFIRPLCHTPYIP